MAKNMKEEVKNIEHNSLKKKSILAIILFSLLFVIGIVLLIFAPELKKIIEKDKISREIRNTIKDYNFNKINSSEIKKKFSKDISTDKRNNLEIRLESYLIFLTEKKEEVDKLSNVDQLKYSLNIKTIDDDTVLETYEQIKTSLLSIKEELEENKTKYENTDSLDKDLRKLYNKLIKEIDEGIKLDNLDNELDYIEKTKPIVSFLKDNKNYYEIKEDKLEFKKRVKKETYDKLINETDFNKTYVSPTVLIEDKTGPVITASNITLTKGSNINLKDKVKCVDEVDDEVECIINGSYNKDKVGEYSIKITSTDKSGNTSSKEIKVYIKERVVSSNKPYYIEVIRNQNTVIVYSRDNSGNYNNIVKVFPCSVGRNNWTPTGTFTTSKGNDWGFLFGGVYGQYSTRITGNILFHSVPYTALRRNALEWEEYNKLGTAASAGCVRLTVRDAKWIYDNIASGTTVKIYDGNLPSGVSKPYAQKISADDPNRGWDPTDPHPDNPWRK